MKQFISKQQLIIFTGNIGTGKSTLAAKLAKKGYIIINNDEIITMVQGGEYGLLYDVKKKKVYKAGEFAILHKALKEGFSVVIDRTNMKKSDRARFVEVGKQYDCEIKCYNFGKGSDISLNRRIKENKSNPFNIWCNVHNLMQKSYEQPQLDEGFDSIVLINYRYKFYAFDFDGFIVKNKYPNIGEIVSFIVNKMKELWEDDKNILIIWTCRDGDELLQMKKFLLDNDIPFDFINENPLFSSESPKVFAHEYYDDRNMIVYGMI